MADKPVIATIRETKESPFSVEVVVDGHVILADEPVDSGGKNLGPYPHEILVAALGACTAQTVRWYAQRHDWPLESVEVDVVYKRDHLEGHSGLLDIFDKVRAPDRAGPHGGATRAPSRCRRQMSHPAVDGRHARHSHGARVVN